MSGTDEELRKLLIESKVSAVLPIKQAPVVTLSSRDSVESALRTLATHKILSAPVVDVSFEERTISLIDLGDRAC